MALNLVTGGGGFVGQYLVRMLLDQGERVRVLDLDTTTLRDTTADLITGSITNSEDAARACDGVTTVFHLAGNAQLWAKDNSVFDRVNHHGTVNIFNAATKAGVQHFIHCSSLTTLVGRSTPIGLSDADEKIWLDPDQMLGPYPLSKRRAEQAVLKHANSSDNKMTISIAIPTEPLGAGDESLTPPTQMIIDFINGKTPAYIDCILNFVPVDALAKGFIAIRDKGDNAERYLLAGENVTMQSLLTLLSQKTGVTMPSLKMPYGVALAAGFIDTGLVARVTGKPPKAPLTGVKLAGRQVSFSNEKARTYLSWNPQNVDAALDQMLAWAKAKSLIQ